MPGLALLMLLAGLGEVQVHPQARFPGIVLSLIHIYSSLQSAMLLTRGLSGSTILLGEDNEANAHRGKPDADMDRIRCV